MIVFADKEKAERKKQLALKEFVWDLIRLKKDSE